MDDGIINSIYDAALEPLRWNEILREISQVFGGATVYLCQEDVRQFGLGDIWTHEFDRSTWERVDQDYWTPGLNPAVASVVAAPVGRCIDRREFFDDVAYTRDPMA